MVIRALFRGCFEALANPGILLLVWLANLLLAVPASLLLAESLREDIGASLVHESLRQGFDMDWWSEFTDRSSGLARDLEPSQVVGIGPFLDNLEAWATGGLFELHPALVATGLLYALLWSFLVGGVLDRFARGGASTGFFGACGAFFGRSLRLLGLTAPLYFAVYRLSRWLAGRVVEVAREAETESFVLLLALAATAVVALLLVLVRLISDYARIRLVNEDLTGVLGAFFRGAGFVRRNLVSTFGLVALFGLAGLMLVGLWSLLGPGTSQASVAGVFVAFILGQLAMLVKIGLRLGLLAAELTLFRELEPR